MKIQVKQAAQKREKGKCPYCKDDVADDPNVSGCSHCGAVYHRACAKDMSYKCGIFACEGRMPRAFEAPKKRQRLRARSVRRRDERQQVQRQRNYSTRVQQSWGVFEITGVIAVALAIISAVWVPPLRAMACLTVALFGLVMAYQNFRQAWAANQAEYPDDIDLDSFQDRLVALRGRPLIDDPLETPEENRSLWYSSKTQEYTRGHKSSSWSTVRETEHCLPFQLGDVTVSNQPTEVHGYQSTQVSLNQASNWWTSIGDRRRLTDWIPPSAEVLVIGKLRRQGQRWVLKADPSTGLLLTAGSPGMTVLTEGLKGLGGLAIIYAAMYALTFLVL